MACELLLQLRYAVARFKSDSFWALCDNCYRQTDSLVTTLDGETTESGIANAFREHFRKVYSNHDTPAHLALKSEFEDTFSAYLRERGNDSLRTFISWSEMMDVVSKLKVGKSSSGVLKSERVIYGS